MKKGLIAAIIVLFGLIAVGGYLLVDNMFPVAAPIVCPDEEDIISFSLTQNNDSSTAIEISDFQNILRNIRAAEPTNIWSIQDYPAAESYYTIEIHTSARLYRYFVYTERSQVYIESPYEGVYRANQQFLDFVANHFRD